MELRTYLEETGLTQAEFAAKLQVTQGMIGHWLHGRKRITAEQAKAIEEATAGKVTRHDLRPDIYDPAPEQQVA